MTNYKDNNELLKFYNKFSNKLDLLEKESQIMTNFYSSFLAGQTELYQKEISETKKFDEEWINTVESYFPSLNTIVMDPRSSIKVQEEISPIEKAKKITSRSIKHLSANTHMLKEVRKDGTIVPERILTSYTDIDYELYENRFIMTLIDRLFVFVRSRYNIIKTNVESFDKRQVKIKSTFPVNKTNVEFNLDVTLTDEIENKEINEYNRTLLKRVKELNKLVTSLRASPFMDMMKNSNKIHPPIMKTNIILKDVNYHNAYLLWLFLDRYNTLAYSLDVLEKDLPFDDQYLKDINRQALTIFTTITANHHSSIEKYEKIEPLSKSYESYKFITTKPEEIKPDPQDYVVEDNSINEYYLETYKEIFKKSLVHHQDTTKTDETAIKRALRETLDISTSLYDAYFNLSEEKDIFKMLITKVDVNDQLKEAKHKLFIATMIREVKEVYYNDSLRLERRLINEVKKFDEILLKASYQKLQNEKVKLELEKEIENRQKIAKAKRAILLEELENVKNKKIEIDQLRAKTNQKINIHQKLLEQKVEDKIKDLAKEYEIKTNNKIKRINEEVESLRRINLEKLKNIEKNEERRLEEDIKKINNEFELKLANEIAVLKDKYNKKLEFAQAEMETMKRLEEKEFSKTIEIRTMRARGKRQEQRVHNRVILTKAKEILIKEYEEKLEELTK